MSLEAVMTVWQCSSREGSVAVELESVMTVWQWLLGWMCDYGSRNGSDGSDGSGSDNLASCMLEPPKQRSEWQQLL